MTKLFFLLSLFVWQTAMRSQIMWQFNKDTVITWNYQWGDEFNADKVDENKWTFGEGGGHSIYNNKEQQYYSNGKNHLLEDGCLKLIARKEIVEARTIDWMRDEDSLTDGNTFYGFNKKKYYFTSGMIQSKRLFNKGFFEIRFKAPADKGTWPAFWLFGGDPNEEIDFFELKGEKPNKIHVDTHCPNDCDYFKSWYGKKQDWGGWLILKEKLTEGFNIIAGEWSENYIRFYLNGICVAYVPVSFNIDKTLEVNLALPANDGPFHPGPAKDFIQSTPFEIDYIRVWERKNRDESKPLKPPIMIKTDFSNQKTGAAKLKKVRPFLYGKKLNHASEGPLFSLFEVKTGIYIFYALGIENGKNVEIGLKDETGKLVKSYIVKSFQTIIDANGLNKGVYRFEVKYGTRETRTKIIF